ncbi:helix-turn-helix domain-containing protein [Bowmanella dokdonensis]|uniref:Helix-turn-helix domain-containing protein n=1 Tax=Bowmanella dokdonensis TaxID=751969 RepID=A0A939IQZ5_9ALTE|nr:helix-turn-helix domain-containing protein [Bowmanella dokdonensis]MBN7825107.1 helix-turn-helix domain-containing protein [Bowmanella dokdonensis]
MDSLITSAAQSLALGDPLGALNRIALRNDAPALALRGIIMAQLGDLDRARSLLRTARKTFGTREVLARARCVVAEAETAFVSRDLSGSAKALQNAQAVLQQQGDKVNAAHARLLVIRRLLLLGKLNQAEQALNQQDPIRLPPALRTVHALAIAGIAMRRLQARRARLALNWAAEAARQAGTAGLIGEVEDSLKRLNGPAACLIQGDKSHLLSLDDIEALMSSSALVVDACRYTVHSRDSIIPLARRPVLFALIRALGEAWPADISREELVQRAFRQKMTDDSLRARLRVEIGRLRTELKGLARIRATYRGFVLAPSNEEEVLVLAHPTEQKHGEVLALLADGESWSSSALALALGTSQRSVQRVLESLDEAHKVQSVGRGRTRRWLATPIPGFTTTLLLPGSLPGN